MPENWLFTRISVFIFLWVTDAPSSLCAGIEHRALLTDAVLRGIHPCHVLICALVGVLIRRLEFNHRKTIPRLPRASHSAVSSPAAPECALVGIFVLHRMLKYAAASPGANGLSMHKLGEGQRNNIFRGMVAPKIVETSTDVIENKLCAV
ncbi:hypothetical protein PAPYR_10766 [Paratrimastix pyriformis]|uniref:Secreted protein n=1 Tax=Paratrimastix pyriformis TaxID=342808 RepID=A0ABQ8U916_9EUKA|nr:hypothetical protein PAPYR_10766 [Paratrimastix pyriformis]